MWLFVKQILGQKPKKSFYAELSEYLMDRRMKNQRQMKRPNRNLCKLDFWFFSLDFLEKKTIIVTLSGSFFTIKDCFQISGFTPKLQ